VGGQLFGVRDGDRSQRLDRGGHHHRVRRRRADAADPNNDNGSAVYTIGKLTAKFTPCLPDGAGTCTHCDRSPDGGFVHVELSYDASNIFFLPTSMDLLFTRLSVPTVLPADRQWMVTE
jgi:hypothetical protein